MAVTRPYWMTDQMWDSWYALYLEAGGAGIGGSENVATDQFRQTPEYAAAFPGMVRDDGSTRFSGANREEQYFDTLTDYRTIVSDARLNPDIFEEEYLDLIEGEVTAGEFRTRVNALEERVLSQGTAIREYYAGIQGVDMSSEGILASLMSDRVQQSIFDRELTMAEVGGVAARRDYDLAQGFVERLVNEGGMDRNEAEQLFGTADVLLPVLGNLAARHGDPDDTFDITELLEGGVLGDAEQALRLDRLRAQEESAFTGGATLDIQRDDSGIVGLIDR